MTMSKKTFTDQFKERLSNIENEAKTLGINWTVICKEAGLSRATPDRWKKHTPKTVQIVDRMEQILARHKETAAAAAARV